MYFQTCLSEWNQLDETIKNSPTISVFKRELVHFVTLTKKSFFGTHDIEGVQVYESISVTFANINLDTNFSILVPYASAKLDLKKRSIFPALPSS